jgi:PKD repeat protein
MRKYALLILCLNSFLIFSQISEGGRPYGLMIGKRLKGYSSIPSYKLKEINKEQLIRQNTSDALPFQYSVFEDSYIDIKSGANTKLPSGEGEIWQYEINAKGAASIQLTFKKFIIPAGAKLFIYDGQIKHYAGAFTSKNMQEDGSFVLADFRADSVIVEYYEPHNKAFEGQVIIGAVGQAFVDISQVQADVNGYVGINCPEGKEWQNQKHSVCLISFRIGNSGYMCSGALINNVNFDGKPYFLTASHCISDTATAKTMVAYFNDEELGCSSKEMESKTLSGASLLTANFAADNTLLMLSGIPPPVYQPYYAGWDIDTMQSTSTVCINHPRGLPKKISIDYSAPLSYKKPLTWNDGSNSPPHSHWQVKFDIGKTNFGSSGSPLFNANKRIIGQLHGTADNITDFYGMLNFSWDYSSIYYNSIKSFLDPDNSGKTAIDGFSPVTNIPDAQFFNPYPQVCLSTPVRFSDNSVFNPDTWEWSFDPNTYSYLDSTSSSSQNPVVSFNSPGYYNVKLLVKNSSGADSTIADSLLKAGNDLNVSIVPAYSNDSCIVTFDSLIMIANGAASYEWSLISGSENNFYFSKISGDSAIIKKIQTAVMDSSINISVSGTSEDGNCQGKFAGQVTLLNKSNDNIINAIPLVLGKNGPYSNFCATIQYGEPIPPDTLCIDQNSWCHEYGKGLNNIEHSVWFTYTGTQVPYVTFSASGFDSKMAIYDATSVAEILNGNYTVLAANDNYTHFATYPVLFKVPQTNGKKYWIQLDGGEGEPEGVFYIQVYNAAPADSITVLDNYRNKLDVYPQPAVSNVFFQNNFLVSKNLRIEIYTISGVQVYQKLISNNISKSIAVNIENWNSGFYLAKVSSGNESYIAKFLKQ